jgi:hypothetical protein
MSNNYFNHNIIIKLFKIFRKKMATIYVCMYARASERVHMVVGVRASVCLYKWFNSKAKARRDSLVNITGIPRLTTLRWYCVFYKSKACGIPSSSQSIGAIFPTAYAHFVSLCHFW